MGEQEVCVEKVDQSLILRGFEDQVIEDVYNVL